ncbi:hypothetical protein B4113_0530 [Geobacillus sp. B4113_201601]|nr:hypothetical protein B4113_0530 [Geobacillus sp. B4113_201601]
MYMAFAGHVCLFFAAPARRNGGSFSGLRTKNKRLGVKA